MTITYANGKTVEGIELVRTDGLMRVAVRGCGDSVEFIARTDGTWLSESGEPVLLGDRVPQHIPPASLGEFICPQDVIDRLLGEVQAA